MENNEFVSSHPANSQTDANGLASIAPPISDSCEDGQSVENGLLPTIRRKTQDKTPHWFVVRATHGRASDVYDEIVNINRPDIEAYIPHQRVETLKIEEGKPEKVIHRDILHKGLLFVRTTRQEFSKLIHAFPPYPYIKGLTPYYDHCHESEKGRNDYLVVPDRQFHSFRTILESNDINILVEQNEMPTYLNGKHVEITSGPFTGVNGILLRWKRLRRVFVKVNQVGTFGTGFVRTCDFKILDED